MQLRDGRHRRADPRALGARRRRRRRRRRITAHAGRVHRRSGSTSLAKAVAAPARATARRPPEGRHRDAPGRLPRRRRGRARGAGRRAIPSSSSAGCARTSRSPTNPTTPTPASSSRASTDVLAALRCRGRRPGSCAHVQHGRRARTPERALRHRARRASASTASRRRPRSPVSVDLRPALSVKARVSHVKPVAPGTRISYGLRYETDRATRIATVPIGYADGVPRESSATRGGAALVRGRRCPIAGTVTMDQLMLDVGDVPVEVGDEVVLIGRQGDEEITADEWAGRQTRSPTRSCAASARAFRGRTFCERAFAGARARRWPPASPRASRPRRGQPND